MMYESMSQLVHPNLMNMAAPVFLVFSVGISAKMFGSLLHKMASCLHTPPASQQPAYLPPPPAELQPKENEEGILK